MIKKIWKRIKSGIFAIIFAPTVIIGLIAYIILCLAFLIIMTADWLIKE